MAMNTGDKPFPTIKGEAVRRFMARDLFYSEVNRLKIAQLHGHEYEDIYNLKENPSEIWIKSFEEWYPEYVKTLPPLDINFDEEYC